VEIAWMYTFQTYFRLKRKHEESSSEDGVQASKDATAISNDKSA